MRKLYSKFVDFEYELSIWLPGNYDSSEKEYPTLYVLDAPFYFGGAAYIAAGNNWDGVTPEMIVIGVGARVNSWDEWDPIRDRDLNHVELPTKPWSGHADAFQKFVGQELMPFVDSNYRTKKDDRLIWGHSAGATFALRVMFSETQLFHRYIVTSPSFDFLDKTIYDYQKDLAIASLPSEVHLFVSVGSLENTYSAKAQSFMYDLAERNLQNLKLHTMVLDGFDHIAASFPGFIYGLRAVYAQ